MQGRGKEILPNGDSYEGLFHKDKKEGQGVYYWADGRILKGTFKKGHAEG